MKYLWLFLLFFHLYVGGQNKYPQDYFSNPLEIPIVLAGTFAELRSNHFHSGLDIKTQQRSGLKVLASANGFVSRIKISAFGYGKALYITHPNGYTTVYAHLSKFSPEIEAYVKKHQYKKESYAIELFPNSSELKVEQSHLVAYSGNTGGSAGPHLHFEIRDKEERPINPMLFGINTKDTTNPLIRSIYVYPIGENASVNNSKSKQRLKLIPLQHGDYTTENIEAFGEIGFGIETIDRQDLAPNSNGVYHIKTVYNGSVNLELDFSKFSFDESKHINQLIDYKHYTTTKKRIQKLFKDSNPVSIYKSDVNNGVLSIADSTSSVYKIRVSDFKNNESWVTIHINGKKPLESVSTKKANTPYFMYSNQATNLMKGNFKVDFYKNTFYKDFYLDFNVSNDTLKLHRDIVPTKKNFSISYDVSHYNNADSQQLYIARLIGKKKLPAYTSTKRKENVLIASTKYLGEYTIARDSVKPTISPVNFKDGQWLSKFRYLKVKIDDIGSGISNYRATVNGKWILMEYEYKNKTLTYDFNDAVTTETKNNLKIIVTDNVGNSSTFEALFYRK